MVTYKKDWKASREDGLSKKCWTHGRVFVHEEKDNSWTFIVIEMKKYGRKPIYIRIYDHHFSFEKYEDRAFISIQNTPMTGGQDFTDKELKIVNKAFSEIVENNLFKNSKKCIDENNTIHYEIDKDTFKLFVTYCKMISTNEPWQRW